MRSIMQVFAALCLTITVSSCNSTDALTPQQRVGTRQPKTGINQPAATIQPADSAASTSPAAIENPPQNTLQAQAQALANNPAPQIQTLVAPPKTLGTIRFLPIIGAPVAAIRPLSRQLGNEARGNGLTIKSSTDTSSEHILKGYLSAFNDGEKTTIVYVWDVLDNVGQRLNRIQGQEYVSGSSTDAWSAVPPAVMELIATKTISQYLQWKQGA